MDFPSTAAVRSETGTQLFARLESRPSIDSLEINLFESLSPGDIIEIRGDAGSGKTELLYHFIIRCILPQEWRGLDLKGLSAGCLFIDNDYHFDLFRLISLMEKKISFHRNSAAVAVSNSDIAAFIKDRLRLLYVVKCSNTEQFMVTLHSLENMLASKNNISCVMIDSISAFYWADRMNFVHQLKKLDEKYGLLVQMLSKLVSNYSLVLIATKQNLTRRNESASSEDKYDFMGRDWNKFVKYHLELQVDRVEHGQTHLVLNRFSKKEKSTIKCAIYAFGIKIFKNE